MLHMTKLPEKLSDLLRLAVRDAQACEADPRYVLYMGEWHRRAGAHCYVCMAGAIMAQTLGADAGANAMPIDFGTSTRMRLRNVDFLRKGDSALLYGKAEAAGGLIREHYNAALGRAPWEIYLQAADMLEKAGL